MSVIVALITDFGLTDPYVGAMKGVIAAIAPDARIVDVSHGVSPFSIENAQYMLYATYTHFPPGTIFCVVVDPGVGTSRRGIVASDALYRYVLPDNGILSAVRTPEMCITEIDMKAFPRACATFHGRDVFAPVAARLALGSSPDEFGRPVNDPIDVPFPRFEEKEGVFRCRVIHIDRFGNTVTSLPAAVFNGTIGVFYEVSLPSGRVTVKCTSTFAYLPVGEVGLIAGSSGFMELAINLGSACSALNIGIGDEITITVRGTV